MSNDRMISAPRALLEQFLAGGRQCDREQLRALLDAPAKPVEPVAYPTLSALLADLPEGYNKDDVAFGWNECVDNHRCSDAQPQGEPVAICDHWSRNVEEWGERLEANVKVIDASRLAPGQFLYTHPAPVTLCDCNQGRLLCRCRP